MTNKESKNELIKRYMFLNENIEFILLAYMIEKDTKIYLDIDPDMIKIIEDFMFSSDKMEESILYILIQDLKVDKDFLLRVEEGKKLLEKKNSNSKYLKENLDLNNIFYRIGRYIDEQSGDFKNKKNKLLVLDEYFRLFRYKNDGKIYTSGRHLDLHDCSSISVELGKNNPTRDISDIGTTQNEFVDSIVNLPKYQYNKSIFTEDEKQEVYLQTHKELPYYLEITCDLENEYIQTMIESRLYRPENTNPCHESFRVNSQEIFISPEDKLYRYYQLCPHCGYIVNIPKEIIPEYTKQQIEERCKKDPFLFRKKYLQSELISLENQTQRTLKK